jgi:RHS repeat-associated protein
MAGSRRWVSFDRTRALVAFITAVGCVLSGAGTAPARAAAMSIGPKPSPGVAVTGVKPTNFRFATMPDAAKNNYQPRATTWPKPGKVRLTLSGRNGNRPAKARAAGTPVWVSTPTQGPTDLDVQVMDQGASARAGIAGVLLKLSSRAGSAQARVGVDYSRFAEANGGNFGARLQLAQLPTCALTTPEIPACRTRTPLESTNNVQAQEVSAPVNLADAKSTGGTTLLAALTSTGSDGVTGGTYTATELKPSGSWAGGESSGSFNYSYPVTLPGSSGGFEPAVGLSYDSGSIDGQTGSTQAQASWAGDGWSTPHSYIEQSFASCKDDPNGSAAPKQTNDLCYDGPVLTLSLNGSTSALVYDNDKDVFKSESDNGDIVTHVYDKSARYDAGSWKVTTREGTVYQFGLNKLPGWATSKPTTNSVDTVPVYGAHAGDPCYSTAGFDASECAMAWRWNLDYVTDSHGNAVAYYYKQDTNFYGRNQGATMDSYVRDSYLDHIDYGFRDGGAYGTIADKVQFTPGPRCVSGTCTLDSTNKANFPDVPFDLICAQGTTCTAQSPTFFSTVRLTTITTKQYDVVSGQYLPVDSYALAQSIPATGDATSPTLWLGSIARTGYDTTAGGSTTAITLPSISFTGGRLPNRVNLNDGLQAFNRYRLQSITSETGAVTTVGYELPEPCGSTAGLDPATNTNSCFPVRWQPEGYTAPFVDWFNKYAVTRVTTTDPTGGAPATATSYAYLGGAAWHFDDNEIIKPKYRTYGQFRGYATVRTFTGDGANDRRTQSDTAYYRGMSKNNNSTVVNVNDSLGGAHEDLDELAGAVLETTAYQGENGPADNSEITAYWVSAATATRTRSGLPALTANRVEQAVTVNRQRVTSGATTTWRYNETDNSYYDGITSPTFGLLKTRYSHSVPANAAYDRCTSNTYVPTSTSSPLVGLVSQVETVSVACGGFTEGTPASVPVTLNTLTAPPTVSRPAQVVSATRTFYDDPTFSTVFPQTAVPTKGDVTMTQQAETFANGSYAFKTLGKSTFDAYGRGLLAYDGNGYLTKTEYVVNAAGLTTGTKVTNPLGDTSTSTSSSLRGLTLTVTDANKVVTTQQYDALGRTTAVWLHSRTGSYPDYKYGYTVSKTGITAVVTERMNDATGYIRSITLYDAQMRPRQTQSVTPQSGRLVTDAFYDSRGWTTATYNGWWDSATTPTIGAPVSAANLQQKVPNQTFTTYDGLGRAAVVTQAQNNVTVSSTTTVYQGDRVTTVPPTGSTVTTTVTDPLGRTSSQLEYKVRPTLTVPADQFTGAYSITAPTAADSIVTSKYGYDSHGNQSTVTDTTNNNTWTSTYNLLGQLLSRNDPDAGTSKDYQYDGNGNLIQSTDARDKIVSYTYDAINRRTGSYAAAANSQAAANQLTAMVYDNSDNAVANMTYPKGQLTGAVSYANSQAYKFQARGFNVFGSSIGETVTIPTNEGLLAGTYNLGHLYTANRGLPAKDVYAAQGGLPAETVQRGYDGFDIPDTLGGLTGYVQGTTQDAYGRTTYQQLGTSTNLANVTSSYYDHTGLLKQQLLTRTATSPNNVDQQDYEYDLSGNLIHQTSTRLAADNVGETQCFSYDELRRLTQAWTATDKCAATPTAASHAMVGNTIGSGSAFWTSWAFDNLGNRTSQVKHAVPSGTDTTTNYQYTAKPHQVTSSSTAGGSTGSSSYTYDLAGNTLTRNPGTGAQTLTWDDAGRLTSVATSQGTTSNVYAADGQLLLQKDPGSTTLYLGSQQFTLNTSTNTVTGIRYYALPGGGTVIRTGASNNYKFALADPLGTPRLYLDSTAQNPSWRQQTPYGENRGVSITIPDNRGFLDKTVNTNSGLVHVGAREYDASVGRFVSVDPIQDLMDPQQWNGYTYANNNPVSLSDPSGLVPIDNELDDQFGHEKKLTGKYKKRATSRTVYGDSPRRGDLNIYDIKGSDNQPVRKVCVTGVACVDQYDVTDINDYIDRYHASVSASSARNGGQPLNDVQYLKAMLDACADNTRDLEANCSGAGYMKRVDAYGEASSALEEQLHGTPAWKTGTAVLGTIAEGAASADACLLGVVGGRRSFSADTRVLLGNGKVTIAFKNLKAGDKVLATDPETGEQGPRKISTIWVHKDDLYVLVVNGMQLTTTEDHPFWDVTDQRWERADKLDQGDLLRTPTGAEARVDGFHSQTRRRADAYNLTVDDLHTYYVLAGKTPVLVHNCGPNLQSRNDMAASGIRPGRNGKAETSQAGLEYDKHQLNPGQDSPKRFLPRVGSNKADLDRAGQMLLDDIAFHPRGVEEIVTGGGFGGGTRIIRPDGVGAVFDSGGAFQYFGNFRYPG